MSAKINFKKEQYSIPRHRLTAVDTATINGSVKVFKYFVMNGFDVTEDTAKYAAQGGNTEIITILRTKGISFENALSYAVKGHNTDVANWILREYGYKEHINLAETIDNFSTLAFFSFLKANGYNYDERD